MTTTGCIAPRSRMASPMRSCSVGTTTANPTPAITASATNRSPATRRRTDMAALTPKRRKSLPKSKFAIPGKRAYPVDTRARAANAKARSTQQYKKGKISKSTMEKVHAKANRKLYGKSGGRGKKEERGGPMQAGKEVGVDQAARRLRGAAEERDVEDAGGGDQQRRHQPRQAQRDGEEGGTDAAPAVDEVREFLQVVY